MILRNRDCFLDLIMVGEGGSLIERLPEDGLPGRKANGFYFENDGRIFGLGVNHGKVWLLLDGRVRAAQSGIRVTVADAEGLRTFSAFDGNHLISSVTYRPDSPFWNFFAMEDEDVDGFTWMRNVISSPERMAVFTTANS